MTGFYMKYNTRLKWVKMVFVEVGLSGIKRNARSSFSFSEYTYYLLNFRDNPLLINTLLSDLSKSSRTNEESKGRTFCNDLK